MFSFTTQTVYNQISTTGAHKNLIDNSGESKVPSLRIGNTRFDAATITSIQIKAPSAEQLGSVAFDMNDVIPAEGETTGRIAIYLGLSMGSQDSFYSNALVYKGKPFFVEFPVKATDTADVVAKRVKAIADKFILFQTGEKEKILDVTFEAAAGSAAVPAVLYEDATEYNTAKGTSLTAEQFAALDDAEKVKTPAVPAEGAEGVVTFACVNGYQIIKKAELQTYDPKAHTIDCCADQGDFITIKTGVPVIYKIVDGEIKTKDSEGKQYFLDEAGTETELGADQIAILPGLEAFGDYNWIIHNLRLPTAANTGFWAPAKQAGELPIVGQSYTQFIITMCVDRDGIAGTVVGDRATSVTTHVLYVAGDYNTASTPANTVYTKLNALKGSAIATTADTKLANPYGTSLDLVD